MTGQPGRKTKYTPETVNDVCSFIREGLTIRASCAMAGVSYNTFYRWLENKSEFSDAIEKAQSEFKRANIAAIRAAGVRKDKSGALAGSWQANAWLMERSFPEEYGMKVTVRCTEEQAAILKKVGMTPNEAWQRLMDEIAAANVAK